MNESDTIIRTDATTTTTKEGIIIIHNNNNNNNNNMNMNTSTTTTSIISEPEVVHSTTPSAPLRHTTTTSWWWWWYGLIHFMTLWMYVYPLLFVLFVSHHGTTTTGEDDVEAVLDELHIVSRDNHDVNGMTSFRTIFTNDYWGRPLTYPASHKSWRPLTIVSFRYLRGIDFFYPYSMRMSDLTMHRFVNVLTHAATADLVGKLAVRLLMVVISSSSPLNDSDNTNMAFWIFAVTKLCFALHPTHVEVVVNAANRSHIVSVLLAVYASDPSTPFLAFCVAIIAALLSSETALFHIVPVAVTIVAIAYLQKYHGRRPQRPRGNIFWQLLCLIRQQPQLLFRILWLGMAAVTYYGGRWYYNTLSIPDGLIRPAENPFFALTGWTRVYSYIMVVGIHIAKQYDMDMVGFSHEYGFNCIPPIETWYNVRLLPALLIGLAHVLVGCLFVLRQRRRRTISKGLILYVVTLAWTVTLFPISGIVKVGTFISDRIVVASTVPIAILQAYGIVSWLQLGIHNSHTSSSRSHGTTQLSWIDAILNPRVQRKLVLLGIVFVLAWRRIHLRSLEWMSSATLLESSLRTCPQFAKGHLEISKIYSGLYPEKFNLTQARYHLKQAERIDPNYCDVHFQFALLEAREHNYMTFEQRLVNALQCGFTMGQAHPIWHQYWPNLLDETHNSPTMIAENRKRYESYMAILAKAIEKETAQEEKHTQQQGNKSPFVFK